MCLRSASSAKISRRDYKDYLKNEVKSGDMAVLGNSLVKNTLERIEDGSVYQHHYFQLSLIVSDFFYMFPRLDMIFYCVNLCVFSFF